MREIPYDRTAAVEYARRWAFDRNPLFSDFGGIGGDCTSFVSQCLFAGCCAMNFTPVYGWYFIDSARRTASWTGVEFLYNFLTGNTGAGPFAAVVSASEVLPGDVVQLAKDDNWYHTLLVTSVTDGEILVAAHTIDAFDRPLSTYEYELDRFLSIRGARREGNGGCFADLLSGKTLIL
ncbi:MAG: amidase domain-containing protein [Eubacteriales bacterium]|nr:amidase domain-containing protein [Eubacteriales bacterium]